MPQMSWFHWKDLYQSFDEIKKERGIIRQIAMDLLYRDGGLSGTEMGEMMGWTIVR